LDDRFARQQALTAPMKTAAAFLVARGAGFDYNKAYE